MSPPPVVEAERLTGLATLAGVGVSPRRTRRSVGRVVGPALAVTYLSLLVVLPLAALVSHAFSGGWRSFWAAVSQPEAVAALKLTLLSSLTVATFNGVAGLVIAWVLVRDEFRGKSIVNAVIDLPFALPTLSLIHI